MRAGPQFRRVERICVDRREISRASIIASYQRAASATSEHNRWYQARPQMGVGESASSTEDGLGPVLFSKAHQRGGKEPGAHRLLREIAMRPLR